MTESAKRIVRRFIEEIVNTGDLGRVPDFVAPALVEETRVHVAGVRSTYPDLVVSVEEQIAEGEMVVTRVIARGTHSGTFRGIAPTHRRVAINGVNIDRVRDGLILEHRGVADTLDALMAVGAVVPASR